MTSGERIGELLRGAARALAASSDSPRLDAEVLLGALLGTSRTGLILRETEVLAPNSRQSYADLVDRRRGGAPIAYLTGTREFWSLPLAVTAAVLVPRPETELLVERALDLLPGDARRTVLDLGTGSGAVALAIASERPSARVTAVDLSAAALEVARRNGMALGLPRVEWRLGSWFDAVPDECFDLIVANPPYIAAGDPALDLLAAEPQLALVAGPTGLEALTAIVCRAAAHLAPSGSLVVEHGWRQGAAVAALFGQAGFAGIRSCDDYAGRPRVTSGTL